MISRISKRSISVVLTLLMMTNYLVSSICGQTVQWELPPIEECISIRNGRNGDRLTWLDWVTQLATADIVFLGESHDDDTTHRLQLAVYQALLQARSGKVVLSLEMFERDVQNQLDDYLVGKIDEQEFLQTARPWNNYHEAYRPMIELAKLDGRPVVAANFPRPLLLKVNQGGLAGLDQQRSLAPAELLANSDLYWKRADNATRSHSQFMTVQTDPQSRLKSTQSLWDNAMGEACVLARKRHPGFQVLHLNGGFHTQYFDGTVAQVRQRDPRASILTVAIVPASFPNSARLSGEPLADFVVLVEDRAKSETEGARKIVVGRENGYWLHIPAGASLEKPAPLLIWLSDDGLSPQENLDYLKSKFGADVAIAVIEPTHRQQERDLSLSGRWFWPDRFAHDVGVGLQTVEGCWQYLLNRFPIDGDRVCIAGEGTGGTLCAAVAMLTSRLEVQAVAFSPRQFNKLKDFPLQLPENWGELQPPQRDLLVVGKNQDQLWWNDELKAYQNVGMGASWHTLSDDPWQVSEQYRSVILTALKLNPAEKPEGHPVNRYLIAETGSARERHWLRILATNWSDHQTQIAVVSRAQADHWQKLAASDHQAEVPSPLEWDLGPEQIKKSIPLCPGPFGGTTVLVLDKEQTENLETWLGLEEQDPLQLRSRFHRLRIATISPDEFEGEASRRGLSDVLLKLISENRKNVLIVPAKFYADDPTMSAISQQIGSLENSLEDQMTLQFLPGIGGNLNAAVLKTK